MFEEDNSSVMVEVVTIDIMTLGGVVCEVALSEVDVPGGMTVSWAPVTLG